MILWVSVILALSVIALTLRGGTLHNYLVIEAEAICRAEGCETAREHPLRLPDGRTNYVDLVARKDGRTVCIEVETSPRNVVANVLKARRLGLPVIVLVPTPNVRRAVRRAMSRQRLSRSWRAVCVLLLAQLRQALSKHLALNSPANARAKTRKSNTQNRPSGTVRDGRPKGT